ncbi:unnamed protein product [Linum trigynum]|uniref:Uncharacterized protein n=1 Tax=Linum trigynum TaxID=586398 RepID=A0AAV2GGI2_9ROSI
MFYSSSSSESPPLFASTLSLPSFPDDVDVDDANDGLDPDSPPSPLTPLTDASSPAPSTPPSSLESSPSSSPAPVIPPRRSLRANLGQPPTYLNDYATFQVDPVIVPTSYAQARGDPRWESASHHLFL